MYLKHCRKIVYISHRRFLPVKHPLRKKHAHYGGKADHRTKPRHICGKMEYEMVKDIKLVFGKGPHGTEQSQCGRQEIQPSPGQVDIRRRFRSSRRGSMTSWIEVSSQ
jgi:hypothetical protein